VDVTVMDGVSVAEMYYSDHPLNAKREPPKDIVRAILRVNAPQAKWLETNASPLGADYALRSSDSKYVALLYYTGPVVEDGVWRMSVALASKQVLTISSEDLDESRPAASNQTTPPPAPKSVNEAQRIFDEAEISGYVGKILQTAAESVGVNQEIKNDWNLPSELKSRMKAQLTTFCHSGRSADQMDDATLETVRKSFNIPKEEEIFGYAEGDGDVVNHGNYAVAFTDQAIYVIVKGSGPLQHATLFDVQPGGVLVPKGAYSPDFTPAGLIRISHKAFLATDSLDYGSGSKQLESKYPGSTGDYVHVSGGWLINGKIALEFANAWPSSNPNTGRQFFQEFIVAIAAVDIRCAIDLARQKHLEPTNEPSAPPTSSAAATAQSTPQPSLDFYHDRLRNKFASSPTPIPGLGIATQAEARPKAIGSDLLASYQTVPWGSSFENVQRQFALKATAGYQEKHVSVAEWSRMQRADGQSVGRQITDYFVHWDIPVAPPFSSLNGFTDKMSYTQFFFYQDRLYTVVRALNHEWAQQHGAELLSTMCHKYGQPTMELGRVNPSSGDHPIRAVWESDSGSIYAMIEPMKDKYHLNIRYMRDSLIYMTVPPQNERWHVSVEGAGFLPANVNQDTVMTLKQAQFGSAPWSVKLQPILPKSAPTVPTAKGKWLAVVLHVEWSNATDSPQRNYELYMQGLSYMSYRFGRLRFNFLLRAGF
jgi:hypothetical protein